MSDATCVRAPADSFSELAERLVETGMPWNTPAPTFAIPCATRLLVDVDAVAVPRGERPRVAGGLREPDQQQRDRRDGDGRVVVRDQPEIGQLRGRKPARHVADQRDPVRAEVEQRRGEQAAGHEHERARHRGRQRSAGRGSPRAP